MRFGEGVIEGTKADDAANADLFRGIKQILIPALIGAAYAAYRLVTTG